MSDCSARGEVSNGLCQRSSTGHKHQALHTSRHLHSRSTTQLGRVDSTNTYECTSLGELRYLSMLITSSGGSIDAGDAPLSSGLAALFRANAAGSGTKTSKSSASSRLVVLWLGEWYILVVREQLARTRVSRLASRAHPIHRAIRPFPLQPYHPDPVLTLCGIPLADYLLPYVTISDTVTAPIIYATSEQAVPLTSC